MSVRILAAVLPVCVVLSIVLLGAGCVSGRVQQDNKQVQAELLKTRWGIEVASLRMSGNGHLIDFRYRVFDPDKAALLGDPKYKPCLTDQATGTKMSVPNTSKLGPLRQTASRLEPGKIYFMLFANSGKLVKSGSKVSVVIGDFRAENLTVE